MNLLLSKDYMKLHLSCVTSEQRLDFNEWKVAMRSVLKASQAECLTSQNIKTASMIIIVLAVNGSQSVASRV